MSPRKNVPIMDALPEHYPYRDDGCKVYTSCLRCPVPWCKYDDPVAYHQKLREGRDREVLQVKRAQGKTVPQLAQHFGLSERTIHRILERAKHVPSANSGQRIDGAAPPDCRARGLARNDGDSAVSTQGYEGTAPPDCHARGLARNDDGQAGSVLTGAKNPTPDYSARGLARNDGGTILSRSKI